MNHVTVFESYLRCLQMAMNLDRFDSKVFSVLVLIVEGVGTIIK